MSDDSELLVSIRADLSDLKSKFSEAKDETQSMGESFGELGKSIGEAFAAEKIGEFFKEGIKEFAEFDKQLTQTQFNLERFGLATKDSKEQVESWGVEIQKTTLFTKGEAVTSLNKLVTMTHDLNASLKLSKLAMDVSAASGIELSMTTKALGNAFEGSTAGMGRFAQAFPGLKEEIARGGDAIEFLEKQHLDGFAEKLGQAGLAGQLFHLKVAFSDVSEEFAKANSGAISESIGGFTMLAGALSKVLMFIMKLAETVGTVLGWVYAKILNFVDIAKVQFEALALVITGHPIKAMEFLKKRNKETFDDTVQINKQALEALTKTWTSWGDEIEKKEMPKPKGEIIPKKKVEKDLKTVVDSVDDMLKELATKTDFNMKKAFEIFRQGAVVFDKDVKKMTATQAEEYKKKIADMKKLHKEAADFMAKEADKLGKTIEKTSQEAAKAMTKEYLAGTLTVGKAFEILGKQIAKAMINALADVLLQESVKNFVLASAAAATAPLPTALAAPGLYAAAGIEAAGAGTMRGVAEVALAEGGYVNAPTLALIGENGPEKVTPLSKGHPMDKPVEHFSVTMSFPNVTSSKDFTAAAAQTAARKLFTETQSLKVRSGNRNTSF